jgi:hypothetical protein
MSLFSFLEHGFMIRKILCLFLCSSPTFICHSIVKVERSFIED